MLYRQYYYEALDLIISGIKDRFDKTGYRIYRQLEDLLLKAVRKEDSKTASLLLHRSFYYSDINPTQLRLHLDILASNFPHNSRVSVSVVDIKEYVQKLSPSERQLIAEVSNLLQLFVVMPSTNAISERSFSAFRTVKNSLRSSMTQERLNHLLILHKHKDLTDSVDLIEVANDSVALSEHRPRQFGKFSEADILPTGYCGKCKALLKCTSCS